MRAGLRCLVAALMLGSLPAMAGEGADLLQRIGQAVRGLNYEGTIVYHAVGAMETLRVVHQVIDGHEQEYLQSLDGAASEVIRDGEDVVCLLGESGVMLAGHRAVNTDFLSRWAALPADLERYYEITVEAGERVAGRDARLLRIDSRDDLRFGHRIWFDESNGLPLRTELVGAEGPPLEVMMFTELKLWPVADPARLADVLDRMRAALVEVGQEEPPAAPPRLQWQIPAMPDGFVMIDLRRQSLPGSDNRVDHMVYSDGLATVSVYVEDPATSMAMAGGRSLGAVNTFAVRDGARQVVVVGDVPMTTVRMIGESLRPE